MPESYQTPESESESNENDRTPKPWSKQHADEIDTNRKHLMIVAENLRYLARQGLSIRGDHSDENSNFHQLMRLRARDVPTIEDLLNKSTDKYTSPDIQNENFQTIWPHPFCEKLEILCETLNFMQSCQTKSRTAVIVNRSLFVFGGQIRTRMFEEARMGRSSN